MVIGVRSTIYFGLCILVPLYFIDELGQTKQVASAALSLMLVSGALGTLLGGRLGDDIGVRRVLLGSMALLPPLLLLFPVGGAAVATLLLIPIGACTIATFSTTVVMAQGYLPSRLGVASGMAHGLAMGLGGLAAAAIGAIIDIAGIGGALWVLTLAPIVGAGMALTLPSAPAAAPHRGMTATGTPGEGAAPPDGAAHNFRYRSVKHLQHRAVRVGETAPADGRTGQCRLHWLAHYSMPFAFRSS